MIDMTDATNRSKRSHVERTVHFSIFQNKTEMCSDMNVQFSFEYSLHVARLVNCHNRILCLYFDFATWTKSKKKHRAIAVTPSSQYKYVGISRCDQVVSHATPHTHPTLLRFLSNATSYAVPLVHVQHISRCDFLSARPYALSTHSLIRCMVDDVVVVVPIFQFSTK